MKEGEKLRRGVYEVAVKPIVGINGVSGSSEKTYVLYNMAKRPRDLRVCEEVEPFVINDDTHCIDFNYTLFEDHQLKNLTKADLVLTARFRDSELQKNNIDDVNFTYNLLDGLFDEKGKPLYLKEYEELPELKFSIPMKNIPNYVYNHGTEKEEEIEYTVKLYTNDVFGGLDNQSLYKNLSEKFNLNEIKLFFDYSIGNFEKIGENEETIIIHEQKQIDKSFDVQWNFSTDDAWDEFRFKLYDRYGNLLRNDIHEWVKNKNFHGLTTKDDGFYKTLDGNLIPDGECKMEVSYVVEMGNYYDKRSVTETKNFNFSYSTPQITIDDIQPFTSIVFDKIKGT